MSEAWIILIFNDDALYLYIDICIIFTPSYLQKFFDSRIAQDRGFKNSTKLNTDVVGKMCFTQVLWFDVLSFLGYMNMKTALRSWKFSEKSLLKSFKSRI